MTSRRVRIEGRVQGVSYRAWTEAEARRRGLSGWVRNRSDGSVEALFAGDADTVSAMIEACREGPRAAAVSAVEVIGTDETVPQGFSVRPTE